MYKQLTFCSLLAALLIIPSCGCCKRSCKSPKPASTHVEMIEEIEVTQDLAFADIEEPEEAPRKF